MSKSDIDIRHDVESELQWDPSVDDKQIGVIVNDGVVTLTGQVDHLIGRCAAEEITKRVAGVRAIANEIQVKLALHGARSDSDIAAAAANALRWHVATSNADIKPVVQKGWIMLTGTVRFGFQKTAAEFALRHLIGVKMIVNMITVGPALAAEEVKKKVTEAFRRHAIADTNGIEIDVNVSTVTLRGHVRNWRERDDAVRAAWAAPGVAHVENRLFIQ